MTELLLIEREETEGASFVLRRGLAEVGAGRAVAEGFPGLPGMSVLPPRLLFNSKASSLRNLQRGVIIVRNMLNSRTAAQKLEYCLDEVVFQAAYTFGCCELIRLEPHAV